MLCAILGYVSPSSLRLLVVLSACLPRPADMLPEDCTALAAHYHRCQPSRVEEAVSIARLLDRNTEELGGLLRALNGEYVLPEAGGDLLRDGAGVLPTGAPVCITINSSGRQIPMVLPDGIARMLSSANVAARDQRRHACTTIKPAVLSSAGEIKI